MFNHWIEIVHIHGNGCLDWMFNQNAFPLRESTSIISGNGKGFTLEEVFKSPFTELCSSFLFNSINFFFQSSVKKIFNNLKMR